MGFKNKRRSLNFADFALSSSLDANRSFKLMGKISVSIDWSRVDAVLMQQYTVGTKQEVAIHVVRKYLGKKRNFTGAHF